MAEDTFTSDEVAFNHMVSRIWKDLEIMGFNWSDTEFEDEADVLDILVNQIYMLFIVGGVTIHRPKCRRWLIEHLGIGVIEYETEDDQNEDFDIL